MKSFVRLNLLMLLGFVALLNFSSCDPSTDDPNTDDGVFMVDGSGNTYSTVNIGRLTITTEDLRTTKYNDGTDIPFVAAGGSWNVSTPAYCHYDNNTQKGILYNYYVVETGKIAPAGWHPATTEEWDYVDSLGRAQFNNAYAKAMCFTSGWLTSNETNTPGNNQSTNNAWGLNAKPNGFRDFVGTFLGDGYQEFFWAGVWAPMPSFALIYSLEFSNTAMTMGSAGKSTGASIRCVKDY
jgi:uncharacterized protein (TIGR02145 family)